MSNWDEDRITEALYEEIIVVWRGSSCPHTLTLKPVHQFPVFPKKFSRGKAPSIDFVFSKGYETQIYFAFECKIVDAANGALISNYVKLGMDRYITEKYSAKMSKGGMIGYAFYQQISLIVEKINNEIKNQGTLTEKDFLTCGVININGFHNMFISMHTRNPSGTPFMIYHFFLTF
jgi:hypothetical protein